MGAIWNNTYTVLAGGTDVEFPGVAKLINLHHIQWACRQRLACVDFLCGDFNWKSRFHLVPRPLYELCKTETTARPHETPVPREAVLAG
jgi:CelD/BcsL family acetyltransferase involved in cellulose biosynthesis